MGKRIYGYVGSGEFTREDAQKLTGIHIAFGFLHRDGTVSCMEHDKVRMIPQIRTWNPELNIVLSIVPAEGDAFSRCAGREDLRKKAAVSFREAVKTFDLDGIDFDWEYPCVPSNGSDTSIADKHNFTLLCKSVREELDQLNRKVTLSIAAGADLYYVNCVELPELMRYLDYVCVMTYDLKCGFHALAGHHTALFSNTGDVFQNSCAQALKLFEDAGVPREKLMMGAAFYSRKWENIKDRNHGLLQISEKGGGYGPDYDLLKKEYVNQNGYIRYWDEEAQAPYLFNGSTFLSYDDEESLKAKADYIIEKGYAGIFYWEHKCDSTRTLLDTLHRKLQSAE